MRCMDCGQLIPEQADTCERCGPNTLSVSRGVTSALGDTDHRIPRLPQPTCQPQASLPPYPQASTGQTAPSTMHRAVPDAQTIPSSIENTPTSTRTTKPIPRRVKGSRVTGRVIIAEQHESEPPDSDGVLVLCRVLWVGLVLLGPLLLLVYVLHLFSQGSLLLAFGGLILVIYLCVPTSLHAMLRLMVGLGRAGGSADPIPVRHYRLRDEADGREWIVRVKGHYRSGTIGADDRISVWGTMRGGTLLCERAYNHRTRADVRLRRRHTWVLLLLTLLGVLLVVALAYEPVMHVLERFEQIGGQP